MKNWRCDWCFGTRSAEERPTTCLHCGGRRRKFTRVTTQLELKEIAAASCNVQSSAIDEIGDVNDPRQNVGLKRDSRGRGGKRIYYASRAPLWKRQLSHARAVATMKRNKKESS